MHCGSKDGARGLAPAGSHSQAAPHCPPIRRGGNRVSVPNGTFSPSSRFFCVSWTFGPGLIKNRAAHIRRRMLVALAAFALFFWFAPFLGQIALRAFTTDSVVQDWKAEFERLDGIFPREAANEARRLEIIRKLRQRGIPVDEGLDESIDHKMTPYTILVRGCQDWERLLGW
jgi:hypothetical protein